VYQLTCERGRERGDVGDKVRGQHVRGVQEFVRRVQAGDQTAGGISGRDVIHRRGRSTKPRRLTSTRRAVADTRLAEINHVAATTGTDPALDILLLRLPTRRSTGTAPSRPRP
jgi:hypothetical protein